MKWNRVVTTIIKGIGQPADVGYPISAVVDIPLSSSVVRIALPERFAREVLHSEQAEKVYANIGFANQTVTFHIDTGHAVLSALAGACEKVWLLAPPLEGNIAILNKGPRDFLSLAAKLAKLVLVHQTSADVMFLPPGVIHATFTVQTGLLYGISFRTLQNFFRQTMGMVWMLLEDEEVESWDERDGAIGTWIETFTRIAKSEDEALHEEVNYALSCQIVLDLRQAEGFGEWSKQIERTIAEHFSDATLEKLALKAGSGDEVEEKDKDEDEDIVEDDGASDGARGGSENGEGED